MRNTSYVKINGEYINSKDVVIYKAMIETGYGLDCKKFLPEKMDKAIELLEAKGMKFFILDEKIKESTTTGKRKGGDAGSPPFVVKTHRSAFLCGHPIPLYHGLKKLSIGFLQKT